MVRLNIDHLPEGHRNRPGYPMTPKGLLFHTTNNWTDGTGDERHGDYMESTTRVVSWHETVDKDSVTQHIPHFENAWHAGDGGKGYYNRNFIGLEIACEAVDRGEPLDKATYENAVERAAEIVIIHDFNPSQVQPHKVVYGKDCPHHTLLNHDKFRDDVFKMVAYLKGLDEPKTSTTQKGDGYLHVVKLGDTLGEIARLYDTSVDFLVRLNNIADPNTIYVGQRIKLKGHTAAPQPKAPAVPAKKPVTTPKQRSGNAIRPYPGYALKEGMNDKRLGTTDIVAVQRAVDAKPDGAFGPKTTAKVKAYQKKHKLTQDGIVGPVTWDVMF
jgi:N-acetylmuramoyl-L-alanine amidase CwlA